MDADTEHHQRACVPLTLSPLAPHRLSCIWFHQYALEGDPVGKIQAKESGPDPVLNEFKFLKMREACEQ